MTHLMQWLLGSIPRLGSRGVDRPARGLGLVLLVSACACFLPAGEAAAEEDRPNVLFISVDDLGTWLGAYGRPYVHSPHIDRLAGEGMRFDRAYVQVPVCGASRGSMLTGIYPTRERFVSYDSMVEKEAPDAVTLPQFFRENGYHTVSIGKVFHHRRDTEERSWSEPAASPKQNPLHMADPESRQFISERGRGPIYEHPDVPDDEYFDGQVARMTLEALRRLRGQQEPFFLVAGFFNPHLPFYAPKRYWDLYERDEIPLAENRSRPEGAPGQLTGSGEFRSYHLRGLDEGSDEFHRIMRHGYFACVSYVDKLVGDILEELVRLELDGNTIVVLWADHGFNLGEHGFWGKHNLVRGSVQIPLIIRAPGTTREGTSTDALVESVDLFPTLASLAGLQPDEALRAQWDGADLTPLLKGTGAGPRDAVYTRWQGGDNVVTPRFSYTEYGDYRDGVRHAVAARMLFDRWSDPDEDANVAEREAHAATVQRLSGQLQRLMDRARAYAAP